MRAREIERERERERVSESHRESQRVSERVSERLKTLRDTRMTEQKKAMGGSLDGTQVCSPESAALRRTSRTTGSPTPAHHTIARRRRRTWHSATSPLTKTTTRENGHGTRSRGPGLFISKSSKLTVWSTYQHHDWVKKKSSSPGFEP